jgi:hypothetical protein
MKIFTKMNFTKNHKFSKEILALWFILVMPGLVFAQDGTITFSVPTLTNGTFVVAKGVTSLHVTVKGGGGGGAYGSSTVGGGGGGGQTAVNSDMTVTPGSEITYTVGGGGQGGTADVGSNGFSSVFGTITAFFGSGGGVSDGGLGGKMGAVMPNVTYTNGGDGKNSGDGGDGGTSGITAGGLGATATTVEGSIGTNGSGGGGGFDAKGGNGGHGSIIVTWTCSVVTDLSYPKNSFCISETPIDANYLPVVTGTLGGIFSSNSSDLFIDEITGEIDPSQSLAGTYLITYGFNSDIGACPTSSDTYSITIHALPVIGITPTEVCVGAKVQLNTSSNPSTLVDPWSSISTDFTLNIASGEITGIIGGTSGDVIFTDEFGCVSEPHTVSVNALPVVEVSAPSAVCFGSEIALTSVPAGMASYVWKGPSGVLPTTQNISVLNAKFSDAGVYKVILTDTKGCVDSASTTITVLPKGKIYVNDDATGLNNGSNWANAFTNLQTALDFAACGVDTIWVAGGQYFPSKDALGNASPSDNRTKTFYLNSGQKIFGGFAGTETLLAQRTNSVINAHPSILSGDVNGSYNTNDDVYHVVLSINDNAETILNGFTITSGNATGFGNATVDTKAIKKNGGAGLYAVSSLIKIQTCKFERNNATTAGAIYNEKSDIELNNCFFSQNSATNAGAIFNLKSSPQIVNSGFFSNHANLGGAVYNKDTSITFFDNCSFANNGANINGGAILNETRSSGSIQNTTFSNNTSTTFGGAVSNTSHSSPTITNSIFTANNANYGGAIYNIDSSDAHITSCSFYSNTAPNKGGGVYSENNSRVLVSQCLFSGNTSNSGAGVYNFNTALGGSPQIKNSSFINNSGGFGGAIANFGASPQIHNLILLGNSASSTGGGIYNSNSSNPLITNLTFKNNTASNGGGGMYNSSSSWPKLKNSIFSGNKTGASATAIGADIENNGSYTKATVSFNLLQLANTKTNYAYTDTSGFLNGMKSNYYTLSPQFVDENDPDGADDVFGTVDDGLQLKDCSAAINKGDNSDILATDIAGQSRLSGGNAKVDLGAFENQFETTPLVLVASKTTPFCYGTSVTFTATPASAGAYKFMVNGEERKSTSSNVFTIDTLKNGDYVSIHLDATTCAASGNSDYVKMDVFDLPRPLVLGDTVCAGMSINLFASNKNVGSTNTYKWTGPGFNTFSTDQNPVIANPPVGYSGTYSVEIKDNNQCVNQATTKVLVRPLPVLTISGNATLCEGELLPDVTINISAGTSPYNFKYARGATEFEVLNTTTNTHVIESVSAGLYTWVSAKDKYCDATVATLVGSANVVVNPIPPIPVISEPLLTEVCFGNTLSLDITNCTGQVTWYNNSVETAVHTVPLVLDTVGVYSLSAKCSALGCVSEVSGLPQTLEIKAKPAAPVIVMTSDEIVCFPEMLRFSASCTTGTLLWLDDVEEISSSRTISAVGLYPIRAVCSLNECISDESTKSLQIKAKPTKPTVTLSSDVLVCDTEFITLTSTCTSGSILWSDNSVLPTLELHAVGVYDIKSVCILDMCESDTTKSLNIVIKETPAPPVLVEPTVYEYCNPDSVTIAGTCAAGSTIKWYDLSTSASIKLKDTGIYTVSAVCEKNGCTSDPAALAFDIVIKSAPLPTITSNSPICQGASLTLISSEADSYAWSGPTGVLPTDKVISVADAQAGYYYLTVTYANACTRTDSLNVTFNAILTTPSITVPSQLVVCAPNTVTLVASCTTGTVKWSDDDLAPATRVFSLPKTYTGISARCTSNECYSDPSAAFDIEIKAAPSFTVGNNGPICTGAVLNLNSSLAGESYSWTGPSGFVSNIQNPSGISAIAGTYVLTVTYTNACTATKSTEVVVRPKPSSPNVSIPNTKIVCEGNVVSFNASCQAGTLKWMDNSSSPILKLEAPGNYNVSAICVYNTCPSNISVTTPVEIKAKPVSPVISPPAESAVCSTRSLSVNATCADGATLLWNSGSSVSPLVLTIPNSYSISAICSKNGCISNSSTALPLNIYQTPAIPEVTLLSNASVCAPAILELTATCAAGTVKWSNNATGNSLTLGEVGVYTVTATCEINNCISEPSSPIDLEIKTSPAVLATNSGPKCAGAPLNFTATEGASYQWQGPNGFSSTVQNPVILNAGVNRTGTYTVTVTFANACAVSATTSAVVNPSPVLSVSASPTTVEAGESSTLTLNGCSGGTINWAINNSSVNPLTLAIFNTTDFTVSCVKSGCTSVISTKVTVSNPCENVVTLKSLADDYSSVELIKKASANGGKIEASNKITGTSRINYEAPSIELKNGFISENGTVFTAQAGGCN